uniref:Uncharacterized protein n=1 Tax=Timema monikensis TaxID=170555 RepID=A0A7R9HMB7_9NEOP|nr:unnamed protein product [Timema monikensis]
MLAVNLTSCAETDGFRGRMVSPYFLPLHYGHHLGVGQAWGIPSNTSLCHKLANSATVAVIDAAQRSKKGLQHFPPHSPLSQPLQYRQGKKTPGTISSTPRRRINHFLFELASTVNSPPCPRRKLSNSTPGLHSWENGKVSAYLYGIRRRANSWGGPGRVGHSPFCSCPDISVSCGRSAEQNSA